MNRFLSVGVGALFGGLPALGIATMQQFAQTRGPNSLKATEDKLAQMVKNGEISGDLLDKLKAFQKRAKEKGTGPRSFLSRLIGGASGGDKKKSDTLTKAVQAGDVTTVEKVSQEEMHSQFKERYAKLIEENQQLSAKIKENEVTALKLLGAIETLEYFTKEEEETASTPPDPVPSE